MITSLIIGASIGILGGFHCIAMCGPIAAFVHNKSGLTSTSLFYNLGRVIAYTSLGLIIGLLGNTINFFGWQQTTSIISGVLLIAIILLPKLFGSITALKGSGKVVNKLRMKLVSISSSKSPGFYISMGVLNGLLPCGLVYMALISSFNANTIAGSTMIMLGFGLGTTPLMAAITAGSGWLNSKFQLKKVVPTISVLIGILLIVRGLSLDIPYVSPVLAQLGWDSGITNCATQ